MATAGLTLVDTFLSRTEAKAAALAILRKHGQSPILRRHDAGWGLFASESLASTLRAGERRKSEEPASVTRVPMHTSAVGCAWWDAQQRKARSLEADLSRPSPDVLDVRTRVQSRAERSHQNSREAAWMTPADAHRMIDELRHAYVNMSASEASKWLDRTLARFGLVFARRVRNFAGAAIDLTEAVGEEILALIRAVMDGRLPQHIAGRIDKGTGKATELARLIKDRALPLISDLRRDPAGVAPNLFVASLAFYVSSGGFDGDGGLPDTDISLFGIESHRSIFTHSIVAGAVVETALFSMVDLIAIAHRHLPVAHDRRWDTIKKRFDECAATGASFMSLGLAYHLGVDGLVQPGAYHDLPFELSMEGHQTILTANAVAEGMDSSTQARRHVGPMRKAKNKQDRAAKLLAGAAAILGTLWGMG